MYVLIGISLTEINRWPFFLSLVLSSNELSSNQVEWYLKELPNLRDKRIAFPEYDYLNRPRRQDLNKKQIRFIETGSLYIFSYNNFLKTGNRLGGSIGYLEWPEEYSYEIDTIEDFRFVENLFIKLNK